MSLNKRNYYAIEALAIAAQSTTSFTSVRGLQSAGVTTSFNLDQCFEWGMLSVYSNVEQLPEVELTAEKVLDGHPLLYHLMTQGATAADLGGRSTRQCNGSLAIFLDTQSAASGSPLSQCYMSGLFVSSVQYQFPVDGKFTESVTAVGNNKRWLQGGFTYTGNFTTTGVPLAAEGVNYRQHFDMYTSRFPKEIPGVTTSGTYTRSGGLSQTIFQNVSVSCNLGRDSLFELGRLGPYFRYVTFPTQVQTEFNVLATDYGDGINCDENSTANTTDQTILLKTSEGTRITLGTKNRLNSVQISGGDAQGGGGNNQTVVYRYVNLNDLTVEHPNDPTVALRI